MNRHVLSVAILSVLAMPLVGCGASALSASSTPEHLRTDNDRYAEAYRAAFTTYESEVELAVSRTYSSRSEAEAVAASHMSQRFQGLLQSELNARGLTLRGFRVHSEHHPELVAALDTGYSNRLDELRGTALAIAERVDPLGSWHIAFDVPERDNSIAAR